MEAISTHHPGASGSNWSEAIQPLDFDADFYSIMEWYGIPAPFRFDCLDCPHHAILDGTDASDLRPFRKSTSDLNLFKSWIGIPDSYIRDGKAVPPRLQGAETANAGALGGEIGKDAEEYANISLAAGMYLFGDSATVAAYRDAIERRMAPFEIAVYAARRIILHETGSLTISGPPSVVIAGRVDVRPGSVLTTKTVSRILSDHLIKSPTHL